MIEVIIWGAGPVGQGTASCLLKNEDHVHIVARQRTADALRQHGLIRSGIFGTFVAPPESFSVSDRLVDIPHQAFDYVLICAKSFDSRNIAKEVANCPWVIKDGTKIVLFQNGWGNADIFSEYFPKEMIYNARVITGFRKVAEHHVEITVHADAIRIGSTFSGPMLSVEPLCKAISTGDIPCQPTTEIAKDLWAKMLYSCSLNPLGAILSVPYGLLGEWKYGRKILDRIIEEVFAVMTASGYRTHWTSAANYLNVFYERLLPSTASHESSMLQDIRAQRRTEIDALNGVVIDLGKGHNLFVPYNENVYNMIKFIEVRNTVPRQGTRPGSIPLQRTTTWQDPGSGFQSRLDIRSFTK